MALKDIFRGKVQEENKENDGMISEKRIVYQSIVTTM